MMKSSFKREKEYISIRRVSLSAMSAWLPFSRILEKEKLPFYVTHREWIHSSHVLNKNWSANLNFNVITRILDPKYWSNFEKMASRRMRLFGWRFSLGHIHDLFLNICCILSFLWLDKLYHVKIWLKPLPSCSVYLKHRGENIQ